MKLIAEPWDVGEGGYQVGAFPPAWSEWNGKFRDTVRDFWRGEPATLDDFAYRITGSSDLYTWNGRSPLAGINFVTAHDGFTLHDVVSYNEKHNEANGEENRDGEDHNRSWNGGAEGETEDPAVNALREKQKRNLLVTLVLSQGVPMILGGDEMGRTQRGNNNAYCQDNDISWFDWTLRDENLALLGFTRRLMDFRRAHPVFRRRKWFHGRKIRGEEAVDIGWFNPDGGEMTPDQWQEGFAKSIGVFLNGEDLHWLDAQGRPVTDDSFLLLFNAHSDEIPFTLPVGHWGEAWRVALDTNDPPGVDREQTDYYKAGDEIEVAGRSIVILIRG
jgi:glycogen operon protein